MSSLFKMDKDLIKNKEKSMLKNKIPTNFSLPKNNGLIYKKNILSSIKDIPINTNNFNMSYSFLKNLKIPNFGNNKSNPSSTTLSTNSTPLKIPLKEKNDSNKENSNTKNKLNEYQFHELIIKINETFLKIQKLCLQNISCYNECILWIEQFKSIYENFIEFYKDNEFFDLIKYTLLIMFFSIIIIYDIVNQNKQKFFFDNIKNILNIHLLMSESIYNNSFNNPNINHKDEEQVLMISYKDISNRIFKIITQYQRLNLKNFQILFISFRKLRNENYDSLYDFFVKRIKNLKHQENKIQNNLYDYSSNSNINNQIIFEQNINKKYIYPENNKKEELNSLPDNEKTINKTQINNIINKSIKNNNNIDIINVNNSVNIDTTNINNLINTNTININNSMNNNLIDNSINNNIINDSINNNSINNSFNNNIMNESINNNLINNSINNNIMNNTMNNNIINMNNTINTNTINTNINNISINTNTISTENNLNLTFQPQIKETNNLTTIGGMGTFINNSNNYFYFRKPINMQKTINSQMKGYQLNHHFNNLKFTNVKQNSNQTINSNMNTNTYANTNRSINTNTINTYNNYTHNQQFNYPTSTPLRLLPKPSQPIYKNDYYIQNDPRLIIQETIKKPEEENESIFARFNRIKNISQNKNNSVQKDNTIIKKNLENSNNKSNNNLNKNKNNNKNNDNNNNNFDNIITVTIDNKTTDKKILSSNKGKIDITNLKLNNIKKDQINYNNTPLIPFEPKKPYSLVLDLDETLIHVPKGKNEFILRPGLREFLHSLIPYYELIVFTTGIKEYADQIINFIEKDEKYFSYRLYRESATFLNEQYYKDLNKLGRDLKKIIIVDDKQINMKLQEENGIIIKPFITENEEGKNDFILYDLINILTKIAKDKPNDIRESLKKYKNEIYNKISNN